MKRHHRRAASLLAAALGALLVAAGPALGGEITDENEAVEKIVIGVNDDPEFDPEQSVGGESPMVEEGDEVTFRIALNDDITRPDYRGTATVKDVYKPARFEFVSVTSEYGHTCSDPNASDPAESSVECEVTLGSDGNAAMRIRLRALDIGGEATDPNGCIEATNVVSSVHPSGGDQAQVTICPEGTLEDGEAGPAGGDTAGSGAAGGSGMLPDAAMARPVEAGPSTPLGVAALAVLVLLTVAAFQTRIVRG